MRSEGGRFIKTTLPLLWLVQNRVVLRFTSGGRPAKSIPQCTDFHTKTAHSTVKM